MQITPMNKMTYTSSQFMTYLFTAIIGLSFLDTMIPGIRYIKYMLPFIAIFIYFFGQKRTYIFKSNNLNFALLFYLVWGGVGLIISKNFNFVHGTKDLFFVASYLIPVWLYVSKTVNLVVVFYIFSLCFLLSTLGMEFGNFSLVDSTAPFESSASFVFGVFCLFFSIEKKYKEGAIALLLMFLTLKRIALLALVLCQLVWILPLIFQKKVLSRGFFLCINSFFVLIIFLLGIGWGEELIRDLTGKSVNFFTLGRFNMYLGVVDDIVRSPFNLLLGNGAGSSYPLTILNTTDLKSFNNLHSDSLKIFYEHGVLFFVAFFLLASKLRNIKSKIILLYLCVLFITDNVLIYMAVMFFVLSIIAYYESCSLDQDDMTPT